jgi:hypothetical protein
MAVHCGFNLHGFAGWLSLIRRKVREDCGIARGDFFTDFFCALFMPMFTLVQLEVQIKEGGLIEKEEPPPQEIGKATGDTIM